MAIKTMKKNSLLLYFEIYKEKFFKITLLSIIYAAGVSVLTGVSVGLSQLLFVVLKLSPYFAPLAWLPMILLGPLTAVVIRPMRDFARREPGFLADMMKTSLKSNWKQSLLIAFIQYLLFWVLYIALPFYYTAVTVTSDSSHLFYSIGFGVTCFVTAVIIFISYYIYIMCVTLDLKFRALCKNAGIFAFLCLPRNLLLTLILGAFIALFAVFFVYSAVWQNAIIWGFFIVFFIALFFGFILYTIAYFTFPVIKRYILDPYYKEHPELTAEGEDIPKAASAIDYTAKAPEEKPQSEYVYHNGRLIHRSALEEQNVFADRPEWDNYKGNSNGGEPKQASGAKPKGSKLRKKL